MILARAIAHDAPADLELAFARMGLPSTAREYLLEKLPHAHVLLTGLTRDEGRFFRALAETPDVPRDEFPHFVSGDQTSRPGTALLSGRRDQFDRLLTRASPGLKAALEAALSPTPPAALELAGKRFDFGARTYLMGVINVTPDSFSDGGQFFDEARAVAQGEALVKAGAHLLDIGGESTRPGASAVPVEEELRRVLPVLRALKGLAPLSIDTTKAEVARVALAHGASMVNDISGFRFDPELPKVVADANAAACVMHMQGTPQTMQKDPRYDDVVEEVIGQLSEGVARLLTAGVPRGRVFVDPGIGFGKTVGHNLMLLRRCRDLRVLGCPVLVGTSRKAFLGALTGGKQASERVVATAASVAVLAGSGAADVVRVHDVAECRDALAVSDAVRLANEAGFLYGRPVAGERPHA